jgi:hypothetical protein
VTRKAATSELLRAVTVTLDAGLGLRLLLVNAAHPSRWVCTTSTGAGYLCRQISVRPSTAVYGTCKEKKFRLFPDVLFVTTNLQRCATLGSKAQGFLPFRACILSALVHVVSRNVRSYYKPLIKAFHCRVRATQSGTANGMCP